MGVGAVDRVGKNGTADGSQGHVAHGIGVYAECGRTACAAVVARSVGIGGVGHGNAGTARAGGGGREGGGAREARAGDGAQRAAGDGHVGTGEAGARVFAKREEDGRGVAIAQAAGAAGDRQGGRCRVNADAGRGARATGVAHGVDVAAACDGDAGAAVVEARRRCKGGGVNLGIGVADGKVTQCATGGGDVAAGKVARLFAEREGNECRLASFERRSAAGDGQRRCLGVYADAGPCGCATGVTGSVGVGAAGHADAGLAGVGAGRKGGGVQARVAAVHGQVADGAARGADVCGVQAQWCFAEQQREGGGFARLQGRSTAGDLHCGCNGVHADAARRRLGVGVRSRVRVGADCHRDGGGGGVQAGGRRECGGVDPWVVCIHSQAADCAVGSRDITGGKAQGTLVEGKGDGRRVARFHAGSGARRGDRQGGRRGVLQQADCPAVALCVQVGLHRAQAKAAESAVNVCLGGGADVNGVNAAGARSLQELREVGGFDQAHAGPASAAGGQAGRIGVADGQGHKQVVVKLHCVGHGRCVGHQIFLIDRVVLA